MYEVRFRVPGETSWQLETVAQGVTYGRKKILNTSGRTMDGRSHTSITAIKTIVSLTFSIDITPEVIASLYDIFENPYIEMLYPDSRTNTVMLREFTLDEELSTKITAWNENYKRHEPITLVLEER